MNNTQNHPTPESILQIASGFWASKILLSAVKFQIFTTLAERKSMSAGEIKSLLGFKCSDRNVCDFLDALTAFGFLNREGILETAKYSNNADADFFLDRNKPSYIGGLLEMLNNRLYGFWGNLEEGLLTGNPQNEAIQGENLFDKLYADPARLEEFIQAMSGVQMGAFMALAQKLDFSKSKTLVDVGGSAGILSLMVAKHQPNMNCITWDLPAVTPIADQTIQKFQLQDRVKTAQGDFFKDEFPKADIVTMGNILHDWDEETKLMLMKKAYDALPEGGVFVAVENVIDENRNKNAFGLMMSLNMLIETGTGFDYTLADFNKWATQVGFKSTSMIPLAGPTSAAIAVK
ncbi:putative O-methyltransferase [Flavobacterium enshiense DK69]|uniref:Methyltransferase n=1 Tax=Flavobacterium enshiense DK69 TaxID=1107311 RepID=V6S4N8_9FLAO|nr:methyltransferase [Flavobacterium enshiense]ESU21212.1 putative O-methyltransferase [Flavobacterium enshiense DK69]KGO93496.1 methyltransferase [Flavobacterium enshiense DK69]